MLPRWIATSFAPLTKMTHRRSGPKATSAQLMGRFAQTAHPICLGVTSGKPPQLPSRQAVLAEHGPT
jgi:hypothetical protein